MLSTTFFASFNKFLVVLVDFANNNVAAAIKPKQKTPVMTQGGQWVPQRLIHTADCCPQEQLPPASLSPGVEASGRDTNREDSAGSGPSPSQADCLLLYTPPLPSVCILRHIPVERDTQLLFFFLFFPFKMRVTALRLLGYQSMR